MKNIPAIPLIGALFLWVPWANAATVTVFDDDAAFLSAVETELFDIGFSGATDSLVDGSVFSPLVAFRSPSAADPSKVFWSSHSNAITDAGTLIDPDNGTNLTPGTTGPIEAVFTVPIAAFSVDFTGQTVTTTVSLFDSLDNVITVFDAPGDPSGSFGVVSTTGIKRVLFRNDVERVALDEMQGYTVATNLSPIANAGLDQTVTIGELVTLDGSGSSDPDNGPSPLTFNWTQTAGPAVTLIGATTATPAFTPTEIGSYTFRLIVSDGQDSTEDRVTIAVKCGVAITNATVIRAVPSRIEAAVTPSTFRPHHIEWSFTGGSGGTKNSGSNPFTRVTIVDSDNLYTVEVKVFSDIATVACTDTAAIVVNSRSGPVWELTPTLRPDNERRFGGLPTCGSALLGKERDRTSNTSAIIIPSPLSSRRWEDGYRVAQVRDPGGPNDGYFYIRRALANIDQETAINPAIKPNGRRPARGQDNWFTHNGRFCVVDPAAFLQAVINHEDSGSGPGSTGHYGLLRDTEALPGNDARTAIEDNFSATSRDDLKMDTNDELQAIDDTLQSFANPESNVHGNWSGDPDVSFWDPVVGMYSDCVCFDRAF